MNKWQNYSLNTIRHDGQTLQKPYASSYLGLGGYGLHKNIFTFCGQKCLCELQPSKERHHLITITVCIVDNAATWNNIHVNRKEIT
jgi:hypothetical protein